MVTRGAPHDSTNSLVEIKRRVSSFRLDLAVLVKSKEAFRHASRDTGAHVDVRVKQPPRPC
jgi:hypothetical protein